MLADTAIRNAKPRERPYKLGDSRGLYPLVTPSGGKWWAFDYQRKSLSMGTLPRRGAQGSRGPAGQRPRAPGPWRPPRAERDPAADLRGALETVTENHYAAMTDPKAMGALLRAIVGYRGDLPTRCALRLAPLTFVRPGCAMRNGASSIWTGRVKYRRKPHENPPASPGAIVTPGSRVPAGAVSPDWRGAVCLPRRAVGGAAPAPGRAAGHDAAVG